MSTTIESLFNEYYPIQQSVIIDNDFHLFIHGKDKREKYPHFIVCNGASDCDKAFNEIVESGFYQEQVLNIFLEKVHALVFCNK